MNSARAFLARGVKEKCAVGHLIASLENVQNKVLSTCALRSKLSSVCIVCLTNDCSDSFGVTIRRLQVKGST